MAYPAKTDRAAILSAALEQIADGGLAQLSLRSVAGKLGIAPNALYRYFADRAHLEAALSAEGACILLGILQQAAGELDAEPAIRAMAAAYLRFAQDQAPMHEVVMMRCDRSEQDLEAHHRIWFFLVGQVARISGPDRAPEAAVALWAFLRGMAALEAAEVFSDEKPRGGFEFGLEAWFHAARASVGIAPAL